MKLWGAIADGLGRRGDAVLISIREALGSTPREAGTRMVVFADGTFTGTIGGGTLEWQSIAEAQRLLAADHVLRNDLGLASSRLASSLSHRGRGDSSGTTSVQSSPLPLWERDRERGTRNPISHIDDDGGSRTLLTRFRHRTYALGPELGQCCGGRVTLRYETIDTAASACIRHFARCEAEGSFKVAITDEGDICRRQILDADATMDDTATETYGEAGRTLLLFGAGHVGRALVLALSALPFRVIWVDGRPDAFPAAVPANVSQVRPADPTAIVDQAAPGSFVLIMTHSHDLDLALCDRALRRDDLPYVGVIGSATKRARFERRLAAAGIAGEAIGRLVCPIGALGVTSKLPQAIAAATVVELLVKDELCLKLATDGRTSEPAGRLPVKIARNAATGFKPAGWGRSSGK